MSGQELARVEHPSLLAALSAFGGEDGLTFAKTKTAKVTLKAGGSYSYKYADLGDILPVVRPLLARHGLSWSCKPAEVDREMVLLFALAHSCGEVDAGSIPLGVPKGCKPQELGSAITYARRYAITAQLNLATEEDDDGNTAQHAERSNGKTSTPEPESPPLLSAESLAEVIEAVKATKPGTERLRTKLIHLGVQNVPAGPITNAAPFEELSPAKAVELICWLGENEPAWAHERAQASARAAAEAGGGKR